MSFRQFQLFSSIVFVIKIFFQDKYTIASIFFLEVLKSAHLVQFKVFLRRFFWGRLFMMSKKEKAWTRGWSNSRIYCQLSWMSTWKCTDLFISKIILLLIAVLHKLQTFPTKNIGISTAYCTSKHSKYNFKLNFHIILIDRQFLTEFS